jgi:cyanophycin synthetase
MRITEQRFLRGPNLYAATPCLLAVIDPAADAPAKAPGFGARLLVLLPALPRAASARLPDSAAHAEALEPVTMELQRLAGAPATFSRTVATGGALRVVCGYTCEQVAGAALRTAVGLIEAVAGGEDFDLDRALTDLRATAARHAIGTSTAAVLAAAHKRGIPSLRRRGRLLRRDGGRTGRRR